MAVSLIFLIRIPLHLQWHEAVTHTHTHTSSNKKEFVSSHYIDQLSASINKSDTASSHQAHIRCHFHNVAAQGFLQVVGRGVRG